jgi:hypothetical protein
MCGIRTIYLDKRVFASQDSLNKISIKVNITSMVFDFLILDFFDISTFFIISIIWNPYCWFFIFFNLPADLVTKGYWNICECFISSFMYYSVIIIRSIIYKAWSIVHQKKYSQFSFFIYSIINLFNFKITILTFSLVTIFLLKFNF